MKILALLAALWLLLAPQPPGIALNRETKESAGADEYMSKAVPEGWVTYYA